MENNDSTIAPLESTNQALTASNQSMTSLSQNMRNGDCVILEASKALFQDDCDQNAQCFKVGLAKCEKKCSRIASEKLSYGEQGFHDCATQECESSVGHIQSIDDITFAKHAKGQSHLEKELEEKKKLQRFLRSLW